MFYDEDSRLLVTGGKDRSIKFWRLPERWTSEEVEKFEETEIKVKKKLIQIQKDTAAMLKIQRSMSKVAEDDSDDELNGWDFNNY